MDDHGQKEAISKAHAQTMLTVTQRLTKEQTVEVKDYLIVCRPDYTARLESANDFQKIAIILLSGKIIGYGEYSWVKEMFGKLGRKDLVDVLTSAEQGIADIQCAA